MKITAVAMAIAAALDGQLAQADEPEHTVIVYVVNEHFAARPLPFAKDQAAQMSAVLVSGFSGGAREDRCRPMRSWSIWWIENLRTIAWRVPLRETFVSVYGRKRLETS
jgi:hypothetical protein